MNIQQVGRTSPIHEPEGNRPERRNRGPIDAIRDRALEAQPERVVVRARKVANYQEVPEFSELFANLKNIFKSKQANYKKAFALSGELYGLYLAHDLNGQETKELFNTFEAIAAKGKKRNHAEYYAFLKGALARHLHVQQGSNPDDVERSYREAVKHGDDCSWYYLGEFLEEQNRAGEAFKQFKACTKQYPDKPFAYREMAKYYQQGWAGKPINLEKAIQFYTHAISRGCIESAFNLPALLETMPCRTDEERQIVVDRYKEAIEKGSADAAYNLGVIYQRGWYRTTDEGVKQYSEEYVDIREAEAYFRKANALNQDASSAVAIAETVALNSGKSQEERLEEVRDLADELREEGSLRVVELDRMLEEAAYLQEEDEAAVRREQELFEFGLKGLKGIAETASRKQPLKVPAAIEIPEDPRDAEIARLNKALLDDPTNTDLLFQLAITNMK